MQKDRGAQAAGLPGLAARETCHPPILFPTEEWIEKWRDELFGKPRALLAQRHPSGLELIRTREPHKFFDAS